MTYEEKLQKLRDAGVIDMTLSFGCEFRDEWNNLKGIITRKHKNDEVDGGYEYSVIQPSLNTIHISTPWNIQGKNIGHDLLYGRVCRWINEHSRKKTRVDIGPYSALIEECKFSDLWHRKDLPLSKQQNKEEIVDFIISLLSSK